MSNFSIVSRFGGLVSQLGLSPAMDLHNLYLHPTRLPAAVQGSAEAIRFLNLLGPLAWEHFPERNLQRNYGHATTPFAALAAACLLKLELGIGSYARLVRWLAENPSMAWLVGFRSAPHAFNPPWLIAGGTLPGQRHFSRLLHIAPNACFQFLLDSSVQALLAEFARRNVIVPDTISLDTKHILAWVKENNPKAFIATRFDKSRQPPGDQDCKLGCKRRHNRCLSADEPPTPTSEPLPADTLKVGEFYWGYASGVVAIKVPDWGEFVVAELTQPFDRPDVSYFFPLIAQVERRLGFRPRFGALDAAFDAFYVYDYFHHAGGFAAVPFAEKGKIVKRVFNSAGLPLCAANMPMPLKLAHWDRSTTIIEYERGHYACPLFFPTPTGNACPINDVHWASGGCVTSIATSPGARIRHQLDRNSDTYKQVYNQRTSVERIFSQALALGIERPKLRNGLAIANINTLIYTLINLRLLRRIQQHA